MSRSGGGRRMLSSETRVVFREEEMQRFILGIIVQDGRSFFGARRLAPAIRLEHAFLTLTPPYKSALWALQSMGGFYVYQGRARSWRQSRRTNRAMISLKHPQESSTDEPAIFRASIFFS